MSADEFMGGNPVEREIIENEEEFVDVEVARVNLPIVEVFQLCEQSVVGGMNLVWQGISSKEIAEACRLRRIPPKQWDEVANSVRYMGSVVANKLNERAANTARSRRDG